MQEFVPMKRLGELLLGARLITEEQRSNALIRQMRVGGRIGTAFLEEGVPEESLLRALSVQHHMAAAPPEELEDIRPEHLKLIPARLAQRLGVVPFKRVGRTVSVAMRDPKDLPAVDEVAALTGLSVKPHVACEARINAALEKYYGVPVDPRFPIILRRQGRPANLPASAFEATAPSSPRKPRSTFLRVVPPPPDMSPSYPARNRFVLDQSDPWGATEGTAAATTAAAAAQPAEAPEIYEDATPITTFEPDEDTAPRGGRADVVPEVEEEETRAKPDREEDEEREIGEDTKPARAPSDSLVDRLAAAQTREEVADLVLEAASEHVRRAALFIAREDRVIGWAALPAPPDGLRDLALPWSEPSVFATIRNTEGFYVGTYPDLPGTVRTLRALGSDGLGTMAVVPVNLKSKTVLFLWGESDSYTRPPSVPHLKRLAAMTATALEILLLKKRLTNL